MRGNFLAVEEEGDAGGVADSDGDLARGMDGRVRRRNERFLGNQLAVGKDGDPGILRGADDQRQGIGCMVGGFGSRLVEIVNGDVGDSSVCATGAEEAAVAGRGAEGGGEAGADEWAEDDTLFDG